jgi:peptidoglycan/LPS O-acetylase OafA/YrhL
MKQSIQKNKKSERQYYLDWMRIILILTVFLFHIGMIFNTFGWHIKNDQQFSGLSPVMSFLHLWRMPLLFLISGAGTYYALGKRKTRDYLLERVKRLIIPLIAGIFLLVPVQVYIERISQYNSLFHYYTHMFDGVYPEGNFSWHHLWFIVYLFLISLIISPFLSYLKSRNFRKVKLWLEKLVTRKGGLNIIILPLLISQLLLKPHFPKETHDVINDWAFISFNLIFFLAGFVLFVNPRIIYHLKKQKYLFLTETFAIAILWFSTRNQMNLSFLLTELLNAGLAWSCTVTALAFAASAMNKNTPFRKHANEAIYPFYLLHQPVIIILGYFIIQWETAVSVKAFSVLSLSFFTTIGIYWFLIRPSNLMRLLFGMKKKRTLNTEDSGIHSENAKYVCRSATISPIKFHV